MTLLAIHFAMPVLCSSWNKKFNISSHMKTKDDKEAMERYVEKQQQGHIIDAFLNNPVENHAKSLELRLALSVTQ